MSEIQQINQEEATANSTSSVLQLWWTAADRLKEVFLEYKYRFLWKTIVGTEQTLCDRCQRAGIHGCDCKSLGDPTDEQAVV